MNPIFVLQDAMAYLFAEYWSESGWKSRAHEEAHDIVAQAKQRCFRQAIADRARAQRERRTA